MEGKITLKEKETMRNFFSFVKHLTNNKTNTVWYIKNNRIYVHNIETDHGISVPYKLSFERSLEKWIENKIEI